MNMLVGALDDLFEERHSIVDRLGRDVHSSSSFSMFDFSTTSAILAQREHCKIPAQNLQTRCHGHIHIARCQDERRKTPTSRDLVSGTTYPSRPI